MALCDRCHGRMYDPEAPHLPCRQCGGTCVTSCCEGVGGDVLDMPTDPNERSEK